MLDKDRIGENSVNATYTLADTGGLLIIIALFSMLIGVLRHTGKQDAGAMT